MSVLDFEKCNFEMDKSFVEVKYRNCIILFDDYNSMEML